MSLKSFLSIVDPDCLKIVYSREEYERIASIASYVNATVLYKLYTLDGGTLTYPEFYKELKHYLYYDKYICEHGTEFMYLVKFKDRTLSSPVPTDVINIVKGFI